MPLLPETIKYNDKLFRKTGIRYADNEIYGYGNERILVEPTGEIWHHYIMEDNQDKRILNGP